VKNFTILTRIESFTCIFADPFGAKKLLEKIFQKALRSKKLLYICAPLKQGYKIKEKFFKILGKEEKC
jgi:hypothetical protein